MHSLTLSHVFRIVDWESKGFVLDTLMFDKSFIILGYSAELITLKS